MDVIALRDRYDFFRKHAGYQVGRSAAGAMRLARAEETAERRGLAFGCEWEVEPWDGDCPPPKELYWCFVAWAEDVDPEQGTLRKDRSAEWLAAVGMVGVTGPRDPYLRVVRAELFAEALDGPVDEQDAARASELAERATYACGGER